jgi:hypothetical protein
MPPWQLSFPIGLLPHTLHGESPPDARWQLFSERPPEVLLDDVPPVPLPFTPKAELREFVL